MSETDPLLVRASARTARPPQSANVDFDPDGDGDNPLEWPKSYKLGVVSLLAFMSFVVTFTCIGIVPLADHIVLELEGRATKSASILLVTIWELGEAAGPLLIAPLSEIYGRYPVYNVCNLLFIVAVLLAVLSQSTTLFIISRCLNGLAVASNVLNPSIIGDMFPPESRGAGMSLIMLSPLLGGAIGPLLSGFVAESLGWRAILWACAGIAVICEIVFFFLLRETYKVAILRRRAARLREVTGNENFKCAWDSKNDQPASGWVELNAAIVRPVTMFWDSTVLQMTALYGGFVFSLYYVMATTFPEMLRDVYNFPPSQIGISFLSFSIGATVTLFICNIFVDKIYRHLAASRDGSSRPEDKVPLMIAGACLLPFIIALYGWAPYARWSVWILEVMVALIGSVILLIWIPAASYVVDAFGLHSASAMTMILIFRCLGGTLLPLAIPALIESLGLGYGFIVFGAVGLVLAILPVLTYRYGPRWRQKSKYTQGDLVSSIAIP